MRQGSPPPPPIGSQKGPVISPALEDNRVHLIQPALATGGEIVPEGSGWMAWTGWAAAGPTGNPTPSYENNAKVHPEGPPLLGGSSGDGLADWT
eukprot:1127822-Pyramimonas_sp.AAC.1